MISLKEAAEFTKQRHGKQKRMQGTPYYEHPYTVAKILKDKDSILAKFLIRENK